MAGNIFYFLYFSNRVTDLVLNSKAVTLVRLLPALQFQCVEVCTCVMFLSSSVILTTSVFYSPKILFFFLSSIDKVPKVTSPVLVIHGTDDEVIDFSHGVNIYEKCPRAVEPLWVEVSTLKTLSFVIILIIYCCNRVLVTTTSKCSASTWND